MLNKKMIKLDVIVSSDKIKPYGGISEEYYFTLKDTQSDEQIQKDWNFILEEMENFLSLLGIQEYRIVSHLRRQ